MTIKTIPNLKPWEVMKRASEGEPWARRVRGPGARWQEASTLVHNWNLQEYEYAIIDTSEPEIDWDAFDWDFFAPYGGLPTVYGAITNYRLSVVPDADEALNFTLRESPLYYWSGDECPVPGNVEVHIIMRDSAVNIAKAEKLEWSASGKDSGDIIAFKLTGNISS